MEGEAPGDWHASLRSPTIMAPPFAPSNAPSIVPCWVYLSSAAWLTTPLLTASGGLQWAARSHRRLLRVSTLPLDFFSDPSRRLPAAEDTWILGADVATYPFRRRVWRGAISQAAIFAGLFPSCSCRATFRLTRCRRLSHW